MYACCRHRCVKIEQNNLLNFVFHSNSYFGIGCSVIYIQLDSELNKSFYKTDLIHLIQLLIIFIRMDKVGVTPVNQLAWSRLVKHCLPVGVCKNWP